MKRFAFASLLLLLATFGAGSIELTTREQDWVEKLQSASTVGEVMEVLNNPPSGSRHPVIREVRNSGAIHSDALQMRDRVLNAIELDPEYEYTEVDRDAIAESVQELAGELDRPVVTQREIRIGFEWLIDAIDAILDWIFGRFDRPPVSGSGMPNVGLDWLQFLVWGIILLAFALVAFLLIRRGIDAKRNKSRRRGLIEEDEEGLTSDDWLKLGDDHFKNGRFRESIRAFYLGSLIRLDENGVLLFKKDETNWEHLRRYEKFSRQIEEFDLSRATLVFDQTWYGLKDASEPEAKEMRTIYESLLANIRKKAS